MPRLRAKLSEARKCAIMRDVLADVKPTKAIAQDHGVSLSWTRNVLWHCGYRAMQVSKTEREAILKARAADTFLQKIVNHA